MRFAVVCQSRSHAVLMLQALGVAPEETLFAVESVALERFLKRAGCGVVRGSLRDRSLFRQILPANLLVVSLRDTRRLKATLEAVSRERGETPVLVLSVPPVESLPVKASDYPWAYFVPLGGKFREVLRADARLARAKIQVRRLRGVMEDSKKPVILLQDDPDPDGLACGLALRTLLGKNRASMPMASFGKITRPENLEMVRVLDLEVHRIGEEDLERFDRIVMVDTQPPHLRRVLPRVDVVIDHHPVQTSYEARFKDVRNSYGATATILVEYLRAEGVKINERMATALLYAIRTDTLLLDRPVDDADLEAFNWVFARANINWIRKIERPALPREVLPAFAEGLKNALIADKVIFSHLGDLAREDIVPQLADFCLQVEGVDWSVVSGVFEGELIISVRNPGFVQRAGTVVKAAFAEAGSAGGHRAAAKAVLPLAGLPGVERGRPSAETYRWLEERFRNALRGSGNGAGSA